MVEAGDEPRFQGMGAPQAPRRDHCWRIAKDVRASIFESPAAAAHFVSAHADTGGIPPLAGREDNRSGAPTRKQGPARTRQANNSSSNLTRSAKWPPVQM